MVNPYIGQISMVGFNFAPRNWALCNGQLLAINSNQALFSLIGCTYGGDCRTSFALPDLRGRAPLHSGNGSAGPGLSPYNLGQRGGTQTNTLVTSQIPSHTHSFNLAQGSGNQFTGNGNGFANVALNVETGSPNQLLELFKSGPSFQGETLHSGTVGNTGSNIAVNNLQPYLAINFCISLYGVFPPRN